MTSFYNYLMDNQKFIRIVDGEKHLDMSLDIIAKYPNSPFYSYFKEYSIEDISFADLCINQNFQLNFDSFVSMYNVISNKCDYMDAPEHIKNIIDKFGLIDPTLNHIGCMLENDRKTVYAEISKSIKQSYDKFTKFLSAKNTFFVANFDEYQKYKDILSTNQSIIPVQIILNKIRHMKNPITISGYKIIIQSINIYNGLPLYHASIDDDEPDMFFLEDENISSSININSVRKKMLDMYGTHRKFSISTNVPYTMPNCYDEDDYYENGEFAQYFYSDDIRCYIRGYCDMTDHGYINCSEDDISDDDDENYIKNSKVINFSYMIDRKQIFRNVYTIIAQNLELLQKMNAKPGSKIIFGFVHVCV